VQVVVAMAGRILREAGSKTQAEVIRNQKIPATQAGAILWQAAVVTAEKDAGGRHGGSTRRQATAAGRGRPRTWWQ